MVSDDTLTLIGRAPHARPSASPRDNVRWVIPPLVHERRALTAAMPVVPAIPAVPDMPDMTAMPASQCLPGGYRLGEHVVTEGRGQDGLCELAVVTHVERGSLHVARVVGHEHAALAPALLEAARLVQQHPHRNLLTILGTGWTAEATPRAYVVHDRLVGRSLASLLAGRGGVEWPLVLAIGLQCAEALDALHRLGLAHTDLKPESAALVHVAGDQFRVVLGGLDRAQAIPPGAYATEEPRVRDDLHALGHMLVALAARSETSGSRVPEVLSCLLWRMIDPRPAIRPASAGELHDQLSAVHEHVDPELSGARMMGEVFRRITSDDFEVSIEADTPPRIRHVEQVPARARATVRPRGDVRRWATLLLVGLLGFAAGAWSRDVQGPSPLAAQLPGSGDDERDHGPAGVALRRIPERLAPTEPTFVTLPRGEERPAPRGQGSHAALLPVHSPAAVPSATDGAEGVEVASDESDESDGAELMPIPGTPVEVTRASS